MNLDRSAGLKSDSIRQVASAVCCARICEELRQMERERYAIYDQTRDQGWGGGFASAKGAYRFVRRAHNAVEGLSPAEFGSRDGLLGRIEELVASLGYDDDYPKPTGAMKAVRALVRKHRSLQDADYLMVMSEDPFEV